MGFNITGGYRFLNGEIPSATKLNRLGEGTFGVNTLADMEALDVSDLTTGDAVIVLGYYSVGDGGGGTFYYDSSSSATPNGGTIIAPDSGSGRWIRIYSGAINVRWFGAKGDNSNDDTAEIQAAIDYAESLSRATVYAPAGRYLVSATLTINSSGVNIVGDGMWDTVITRSGNFGDTMLFTGNDGTGTVISDVGISNIAFQSTGQTTSGAHLVFNGVARANVYGIYMLNGFIGFNLKGLTAAYIDTIYVVFTNIFSGSATGRRFMECGASVGTYGHPTCGDLFISNFNLRGNVSSNVTEKGLNILGADGIWFENGHVGNTTSANLDITNNGTQLEHVFFSNVMFDEGIDFNVLIEGSHASNVGQAIFFNNCNVKGGGTASAGVTFGSGADFYGVQFNNCQIWQHLEDGVKITSTDLSQISFNNCIVRGNSLDGSASFSGYKIDANVGGISIIGGSAGGDDNTPTGASLQAYGIDITTGSGNNIIIQGVDTRLNVTAGIRSFATGDNVHITDNFDGSTNSVASASSIDLPMSGQLVTVTGTTNISSITALGRGASVTLVFEDVLTVNDGSNLVLNGNFVTTANDTLSLVCDGTNWIETSRSTN